VLSSKTIALYSLDGEASTGNAAYIGGGLITPSLYFPAGTYNISSALVTGCPVSLSGDGPTASVIFQTHQYIAINGIVANYSLWMTVTCPL
jgi:hypothetical protein